MSDEAVRAPAAGGVRLSQPPWRPRAAVGLIAVAVALVAAWWAIDSLWLAEPPAADVAGHEALTDGRTPAVVTLARVATRLGDAWVVAAIAAGLALLARWRTGRWDPAILAVTVIGGVALVTNVVKAATVRVRPEEGLIEAITHAFPSGHASRAGAVSALAGWLAWRLAPSLLLRVSLVALAVVVGVAIGLSRLLLGVHWPTDVLAGWVLGGLWTLAALAITRPRATNGPERPA